jgi:cell wall-associated NlpC family hydrolase
MRLCKHILYGFALLIALSSCRNLRSIAAKDQSQNQPTRTVKKHPTSVQPQFIETISITPATAVTTKHTGGSIKQIKKEKTPTSNNNNTLQTNSNQFITSFNIEQSNELQLKYAIVLDASVEKMTNQFLLEKIEEWWGTKYCMGGSTKNCIDCSAFTQVLLKEVWNIDLPRTASEQHKLAQEVAPEDLQEGDLVFFHTQGRREITHVGIYLINNKFVHASTSNGVMVSDLNDSYWKTKYKGAGRIKANATLTTSTTIEQAN